MTPALGDIGKRLLLGRKLRSTQLGETLLPKRIALPVFASDALSSVAYAPDEIFLTLSIAGLAAMTFSWKVAIVVAVVLLVVVLSYRQNVHAYPSGGGDYEVANVNLGPTAGLTVASALLVDYTLTVAVSISSAAQYAASAIPALEGHQATAAVIAVLFLTTMNLRGVRESGTAFAIPTYVFMVTILGMAAWGFGRYLLGDLPEASSAGFDIAPEEQFTHGVGGLAMAFLVLRAFSSGCAALTGVEAISNGVPAFRKPKSKNAATTLMLLGCISITMVLSVVTLANVMKVRFAEDPATQLLRDGVPVGEGYHQDPIIGQLAKGIFDHFSPGFYLVAAATGVILVLAANTAFNGFPVLGSILARDGYLPRQLHTRGDRLAFSNGIVILAGFAILLIVAFNAEVTRLIQLYIVGVFVSFTISQTGMVRHWTRLLRTEQDPGRRRKMQRSRVINAVGLSFTGVVLIVVLATKFLLGAYIAIIAMAVLFLMMRGIRRHYETVRRQMAVEEDDQLTLPSRVHSIVLVSKLHKPTLRALAFAKAARPYTLEAVTVDVDREESDALQAEWDRHEVPIPLKRLASPYREITRPILQYVRDIRRQSPRDVVMVYIPEYVVGHWWEQVLHNQSALRLKVQLLFTPGVMVTSVPYQLLSSQAAEERKDREERVAGQVRRGARKTSGDR
ncbi:amino acid transporter [Kribbella sp. VKM Ac-2527]|uniref:Amino acid transporter n=1 Tax=Kribbella caucasensis TaxID=2512215 RepID=A0A4V3C9F0_9ACTN|nr:APC family permease [Kribbella sp. VKM Ac-2527]TDO45295.1 amino acid transporter [Kribbella sp. VKM Ac-2527]